MKFRQKMIKFLFFRNFFVVVFEVVSIAKNYQGLKLLFPFQVCNSKGTGVRFVDLVDEARIGGGRNDLSFYCRLAIRYLLYK